MTYSQDCLQFSKNVQQGRNKINVGGKTSKSFRHLSTRSFVKRSKIVVAQSSSDEENIYLGYDKQQQQPKYQKDDPSKYPNKEDVGIALGVTGGWAGGEKGLKSFIEQSNGNVQQKSEDDSSDEKLASGQWVKKNVKGKEVMVKVIKQGSDTVYVGDKYIEDDDRKYPNKESIGPLEGITGGFAGGETGLKNYLEKGEVELEQEKSRRQFSPLYIAAIVAFSGVVGGIGLTYSTKWAAQTLITELLEAPIDDNTKLLVEVAIVLLVVAAMIAGGRFAFKRMGSINENWAKYATIIAIAYGSLFVIVRTLIDMDI